MLAQLISQELFRGLHGLGESSNVDSTKQDGAKEFSHSQYQNFSKFEAPARTFRSERAGENNDKQASNKGRDGVDFCVWAKAPGHFTAVFK